MSVPRRVAVVIGAGSVKCSAGLGLMKVLHREGIGVDLFVGCSGGALYATLMAEGLSPDDAADKVSRLWTRKVTEKRNRKALLSALFPRLFGFKAEFGMTDDRPVNALFRGQWGDRTIESLPKPLHITATDFETGEQAILSKGRIVDALRASIAIPFVFAPWRVDGRLLSDGFLSDPLPVGVAIREGADVILAMGFDAALQSRVDSAARFAFQVSSVMTNNLLKANYAFHTLAHHHEVIPIVPQFSQRIRLFDTEKIPYLIEEGEKATMALLPHIRRALQGEPG